MQRVCRQVPQVYWAGGLSAASIAFKVVPPIAVQSWLCVPDHLIATPRTTGRTIRHGQNPNRCDPVYPMIASAPTFCAYPANLGRMSLTPPYVPFPTFNFLITVYFTSAGGLPEKKQKFATSVAVALAAESSLLGAISTSTSASGAWATSAADAASAADALLKAAIKIRVMNAVDFISGMVSV